jgi:hypothetical protein
MKTFLAIALLVVVLCISGVKGQIVDTKARNSALNKVLNLENSYSIPGKGGKFKMLNPNLFETRKGNQLKAASEGNQKLDSTIYEALDNVSNQLVISFKAVYTYDANGFETSAIGYFWNDTTSQWMTGWKHETTYDVNENLTIKSTYFWDDLNNQWVYIEKQEYTYDNHRNLILDFAYHGIPDQLLWAQKYENTYDASGNLLLDDTYDWEASHKLWVITRKSEYTYDTNGNLTAKILYNWDEGNSQWVLFYKMEFIYDASGNTTLNSNSYYNTITDQWYVDFTKAAAYDNNGNITVDSTFSEEWGKSKSEYAYDNNEKRFSQTDYYWNEATSQWSIYQRYTYYYSELNPTLIPGISERKISVYPNPATDFIVFDLTNISESAIAEIFDIQGKKVLEQKLSENKQISVSNLPKGLYMYKLNNNGNTYTGKFLIE